MAAKKTKQAPAAAQASADSQPTAGSKQSRPQVQSASFDNFNGEEVSIPDIDGWYSPEEGEAGWVGRIIGAFRMKDAFNEGRMRDVVVVRLLSTCSSAVDADGEPTVLEAGNSMAVSIKAKLASLLEYVERHGTVGVKAIDKKKLDKGRSMWVFAVKGQPGARVQRESSQSASGSQSSTASGDVPW